jgi:pimeloyl-ACP methyl ester carboxylesterase
VPDYVKQLRGESVPQVIPGTAIRFAAPGLKGELTVHVKTAPGDAPLNTRSGLRDSSQVASNDQLDQAIREVSVLDSYNLETEASTPKVTRPEGTRAGVGELGDDEALLEYEAKPGEYSFVIYRDEEGVISIHFPENLPTTQATPEHGRTVRSSASQTDTYRIALRKPSQLTTPPSQSESQTRFGIATIGKKLIKLVVGKVIKKTAAPLVGAADFGAVWVWENRARAFQGFHGGKSAQELLAENPVSLSAGDWAGLQADGKKTLLLIHGTTSTTSGAFGGLDSFQDVANALYGMYQGRVIGFNHHTLTLSVADNVADFYSELPTNGTFHFDIICHSRGGLVARALKELTVAEVVALTKKAVPSTVGVKIGKIIFVGTPNTGTQLADPKDIPQALNVLANVASLIPGAGLTLAGIFSSAAFVAENGFAVLPGMRNMNPSDNFLAQLNQTSTASTHSQLSEYYAVQSSFSSDTLVNKILLSGVRYLFKDNLNDLIVPTLGTSNIDGIMLPESFVNYFGKAPKVESIAHTQYFQHKDTWDFILEKLK